MIYIPCCLNCGTIFATKVFAQQTSIWRDLPMFHSFAPFCRLAFVSFRDDNWGI